MSFRKRFFERAYERDKARWDTGITPPEVVAFIEGAGRPTPGRALDLGCGTGTNALYLARHGWDVIGVDFSPLAIRRAEEKRAAVASGASGVTFLQGDVSALDTIGVSGQFDFVLDIGCFHSLSSSQRTAYVSGIADRTRAGATVLLFAFGPPLHLPWRHPTRAREMRQRFGKAFELVDVERGTTPSGAAWFRLERRAEIT